MQQLVARYWRVCMVALAVCGWAGIANAQSFLDACFTSPTVGTSFAGTANVSNRDSDLLRWTGSAWVGYWPMANVTIAPPGSIVNSRAIWSGDGTVWTTGGEGFGLRLVSPVVSGTTYTFAFQRVSHGYGQNGTFAPVLYTNTGGSFGTSYGAIPAVGTTWTTTNITFTATAGSAGHTFVYFHNNVGSGLFLGCTAVVLPMAFSDLQAFPAGQDVHLQWRVQDETNYAWHVVERSADGVDFVEIGRTQAVRAAAEGHYYTYEDALSGRQSGDRLYYRIRSIDDEGMEALSPVVEATLAGSSTMAVQVSPNPVTVGTNAEARFHGEEASATAYTVTDIHGKVVLEGLWNASSGIRAATLPVATLAGGVYSVTLRSGSLRGNCRIVIQ